MVLPSLLILLAFVGHVLVWAEVINRIHGLGISRTLVKASAPPVALALILIPLAYAVSFARHGLALLEPRSGWNLLHPGVLYLLVCWILAAMTIVRLSLRYLLHHPPHVLRHHRTNLIHLQPDGEHHFLVRMPGNESLQLDVAERALELARLPAALDGLTIVHFSDLHLTGRIGKAYFQEVVERSNSLEPDFVAITGDLVDFEACIDWIPDTLGRLTSRYGNYFVLGNHDLLVDTGRLRRTLTDAGLVDLGHRWLEVSVRGTSLLWIGNELPWICPAADLRDAPPPAPDGPLRIVLTHTPDQLGWARASEADLLLAGHLHGGQIRFPILGPLLAPSRRGVRYAQTGVYHAPPTVMHVTRGVSGIYPIRMNCPPEIVRLVLHAPRAATTAEKAT